LRFLPLFLVSARAGERGCDMTRQQVVEAAIRFIEGQTGAYACHQNALESLQPQAGNREAHYLLRRFRIRSARNSAEPALDLFHLRLVRVRRVRRWPGRCRRGIDAEGAGEPGVLMSVGEDVQQNERQVES